MRHIGRRDRHADFKSADQGREPIAGSEDM
jgi:hypothetical protein